MDPRRERERRVVRQMLEEHVLAKGTKQLARSSIIVNS